MGKLNHEWVKASLEMADNEKSKITRRSLQKRTQTEQTTNFRTEKANCPKQDEK